MSEDGEEMHAEEVPTLPKGGREPKGGKVTARGAGASAAGGDPAGVSGNDSPDGDGGTKASPPEPASSRPADAESADSPERSRSGEAADLADAEEEGGDREEGHPDSAKRKRRRRKGKGPSNRGGESAASEERGSGPSAAEPAAQDGNRPARFKPDPERLAKFAWKIYLSEISEEGVALTGDSDARELSKRCFRLAEIFLEEESRRR